MPFSERINYSAFVDNQASIESDWEPPFGDRKIELVFIGQQLNPDIIKNQLENCLLNDEELLDWKDGKFQKNDNWPVPTS